jgi:hypothetical protein
LETVVLGNAPLTGNAVVHSEAHVQITGPRSSKGRTGTKLRLCQNRCQEWNPTPSTLQITPPPQSAPVPPHNTHLISSCFSFSRAWRRCVRSFFNSLQVATQHSTLQQSTAQHTSAKHSTAQPPPLTYSEPTNSVGLQCLELPRVGSAGDCHHLLLFTLRRALFTFSL